MADSVEGNNIPGSETQDALKSGKLLYEELPKEDLIRLVKKHLALLQKVKIKCDALNKECTQYKELLVASRKVADQENETRSKLKELCKKYLPADFFETGDITAACYVNVIEKEFLKLEEKGSKILRLEEELNNAQKDKEKICVSFREAEEQILCMKMKLDTLTMTCHCLQEDLSKSQELNKELRDEVNVLTAARDTALQSISDMKVRLNKNNSSEIENLKTELERLTEQEDHLKRELMLSHNLNSTLQQELNALVKTKTDLENENISLAEKCKLVTEENDSWRQQFEEYENEKANFTSCMEKLHLIEQENETFREKNTDLEKCIGKIEEEKVKINEELCNKRSSLNDLNCQIEILISSIKQGVKQKNAANKIKTENEPVQNISVLRILYDEISSRLRSHVIRTNDLEAELKSVMLQKQKAEDEMLQLVDLKQFLEDEAKGLLEENEHLKRVLTSSEVRSARDAEVMSSLEKELLESAAREQKLLNELHNYAVYIREQVEQSEVSSASPTNIPETIMEELWEDETMSSGSNEPSGVTMRTGETELYQTCDASSQINHIKSNLHEISVQAGGFLIDVSTETKMLCDSSAGTDHNVSDISVQTVNFTCDASIGTESCLKKSNDAFETSRIMAQETACPLMLSEVDELSCNTSSEVHTSSDDNRILGISAEIERNVCDASTEIQYGDFSVEPDGVFLSHASHNRAKELEEKSKVVVDLKEALETKSKLVENIHCQIDSLLTKVEELSEEVTTKDRDLDSAGKKIEGLEMELKHMKNLEKSRLNTLVTVSDIIAVLKKSRDRVSIEVNELRKDCVNTFHDVNNVVNSLHNEVKSFCQSADHHKWETVALAEEICPCQEAWIEVERELHSILEVFESVFSQKYVRLVEGTNNEAPDFSIKHMSKICSGNKDSEIVERSSELHHFGMEKQRVICKVKQLGKEFQRVAELVDQLSVSNDKAFKELNNYKLQVIPNLEKAISDLHLKLQEQSEGSQDNIKPDSYQRNANETDSMLNMSKESLSCLQKQVADAETKMNKFKVVAIKAKKELVETKKLYQEALSEKDKFEKLVCDMSSELDKLSTVNHQHIRNFQSLQSEYDKLQDECEELKTTLKTVQGDLAASETELNASQQKYVSLDTEHEKLKNLLCEFRSEKQTEEKKNTELESKLIILEAKYGEKQKKIDELESELSKSKSIITDMKVDCELLKQKLEEALKERKKHSLLDLEMADYERTISELNLHLRQKCAEISELQSDVEGLNSRVKSLQEEIGHCDNQRITEEKRADNLKELLERTKEELMGVKNREQELNNLVKTLQSEVETVTQQREEYKVQFARVSGEAELLKQSLNSSAENHQKTIRLLEAKIRCLREEILQARKEIKSGKEEFENYKVRVHSVLKQQKLGSSSMMSNDAEIKEELQKLSEKLKLQVTDLNDKLRTCTLENELMHEEHDQLLLRYGKIVEELEAKNKSWSIKLEQLTLEKKRLEAAQEELISQHALQHSMLTASFVKQIKDLQEKHKHELKEMQKQLDDADTEIAHLQNEQRSISGIPSTPIAQDDAFLFDICSQERQEGEGSECTEGRQTPIKPMSLATIPTSGFLPLEKLLQSPVEPDTPKSFISSHDSEKLNSELSSLYRKNDHLSELLNESEANNLRLNEQVRLLKEEVRRLERNKEREQHAENLEYLKNVFVKFVTLESGDEKIRLLPVLTTMLKLSPLEQQQLRSVAGDSSETDTSGGWGTYLHRWSGLM